MVKKMIVVFVAVLAVVAIGAVGVITLSRGNDESVSEGICLISDQGRMLIILDGSPVEMHDRSDGGDLFDGLQTGDHIRIVHDGIAATYPAQTGVYKLTKTGEGTIDDIPTDVLDSLRQLGWIS